MDTPFVLENYYPGLHYNNGSDKVSDSEFSTFIYFKPLLRLSIELHKGNVIKSFSLLHHNKTFLINICTEFEKFVVNMLFSIKNSC
jgi:hypothetical protein